MARRRSYEKITGGPITDFPADIQKNYAKWRPTHYACLPNGDVIVVCTADALANLQQMWADAHNVTVDGDPLSVNRV